jgi:hypothetical protein
MNYNYFDELAKILQTSISPVALISGIGLLLLSMTNRLGRTIDRSRILYRELKRGASADKNAAVQIRILFKRSRILRLAISFASASILCASLIIISLFAIYTLHATLHNLVMVLFVMSMFLLVASLILFIKDVSLSLKALKLEIRTHL